MQRAEAVDGTADIAQHPVIELASVTGGGQVRVVDGAIPRRSANEKQHCGVFRHASGGESLAQQILD